MQSHKPEIIRDKRSNTDYDRTSQGQTHGLKLNLGSGFDIRAGYFNIDANDEHHPDLVSDVANLSASADCVACEALAQDVPEHLPRAKASTALKEWNQVM